MTRELTGPRLSPCTPSFWNTFWKVLIINNLLASLLGLSFEVRFSTFSLDIAPTFPEISSCAPSRHASEDRVAVAPCDNNATGFPVLSEPELDLACSHNAAGFPVRSVAELKLSPSWCDAMLAITPPSSAPVAILHPRAKALLLLLYPAFGVSTWPRQFSEEKGCKRSQYIQNVEQLEKMVPFISSEWSFCQDVSELVLGVDVFSLGSLGQGWFGQGWSGQEPLCGCERRSSLLDFGQ